MEEIIKNIYFFLKVNTDKIFIVENGKDFFYKDLIDLVDEIEKELNPLLAEITYKDIIKFSFNNIFSFSAFYLYSIKKNLTIEPVRELKNRKIIQFRHQSEKIHLNIDLKSKNATPFDEATFVINSSGSTGKPKKIFLSYQRLYKSCISINEYMKTKKSDFHAWSMPPDYVYGLSMLNQLLFSTSSAYIIDPNVPLNKLIEDFNKFKINKIYGVPSGIKPIIKYGFKSLPLYIKSIFIAGGRCDYELSILLEKLDREICIMYGCTEASARLTYIFNNFEKIKDGCVGQPINGVELKINSTKSKYNDEKEIIHGDVMFKSKYSLLGYSIDDKFSSYLKNEWIPTGDIGYIKNNNLFITGRKARFAKIGGIKVSLTLVEDFLIKVFEESELACVRKDNGTDTEEIYCFIKTKIENNKLKPTFLDYCRTNNEYPSWRISIKFVKCEFIKNNKNGKPDYKYLERETCRE